MFLMNSNLYKFRVYINSSMFHKHHMALLKGGSSSAEDSVSHPLPNLFRLLGLAPFKKVKSL